jgi:hypothetical protein
MQVRPLSIETGMFADEHGPGAIARAAGANCYLFGSQIVSFAGISGTRAETLFGRSPADHAEAVATVIGAAPDVVRSAFHTPLGGGLCDFFGARIRIRDREVSRRRVAPGALRERPYIRAVWQLKPLSFDPDTRETLISSCPECGKALGFIRTEGIYNCEHCLGLNEWGLVTPLVDLRDYPQAVVEVEDEGALRFVTGLIDPDPDVRAEFKLSLHEELTGLDRGQLWNFTLALACVVEQDASRTATSIARPATAEQFATYYAPARLAAAGRILMSWPRGFDALCERARADTEERGHHGVKAELGQIYALAVNTSVDPEIRSIARSAINRNMASSDRVRRIEYRPSDDRVTTQAASERFGIHTRVLQKLAKDSRVTVFRAGSGTGPRLFVTQEIAALAELRDAIESVSSVALRLGIPSAAVRDLAGAGLIIPEDGPVVHMVLGKEYYLRASVDCLIERITAKVKPRGCSEHLRLIRAMNRLPGGEKPWAALVEAILEGRLEVFPVEGRFSAVLIRLAVATFADFESALLHRRAIVEQPDTVTRPEAASILGVTVGMVCGMIHSGRLHGPDKPGGPLAKEIVLEAARTHIFTSEVSRRLSTSTRRVRTALAEYDVHPVFELPKKRGLAFDRVQVERVIQNVAGEK